MKNYDDIINLPHPVSNKHPQMSKYNRASQFSPFAALTGYKEAIEDAEEKSNYCFKKNTDYSNMNLE